MSDIDISIKVHDNDLSKLDAAGDKLENLGQSARKMGDGAEEGSKGMLALSYAAGEFIGNVALQLVRQLPEIADKLNKMGIESLRAKASFEAMGGSVDTIQKMQEATHGLVDDTALLAQGTELLSSHILSSSSDLTEFARIGATLGITFQGDATKGVETFANALEAVGNVRGLRQLGIDTLAVKAKFEELKKTMGDADAWRMAIFEIAGANADKFSGSLNGVGTAWEKLSVKVEDFVEGAGERFAQWVEDSINHVQDLQKALDDFTAAKEGAASAAVDQVGTRHGVNIDRQYNEQAAALYRTGQGGAGAYQSLVNTYGQQMADEMMRSQGSRPAMLGQIGQQSGGFQPYYARYIPNYGDMTAGRNQYGMNPKAKINFDLMNEEEDDRTSSDITGLRPVAGRSMGDNALRGEYVTPTDTAQKQARDLATVKSILGDISGIAGDYNSKMLAVLAPLQEQQRILEKRNSIQSIDDAFGLTHDGLYSEIGSGMSGAIATRRDKVSQQLKRKIGTGGTVSFESVENITKYDEAAKAERDAYERSLAGAAPTAEELYKGGDWKKGRMESYDKTHQSKRKATLRKRKGKVYTQKDYDRDMQQFDRESKEATDAYAIATGSATKESIKMNDQLESARKNYEDGKISLTQYKNELLLLGEAAKSGATSMDDLTQIQIRLNYGLKMGVTTKGKTAQSDASLYSEHAGGVKGTSSYAGNGIDNETKPFDNIVTSAKEAETAATKVGTAGAIAVGQLAIAGLLAATSMGNLHSQGDTALQTIVKLKTELNTLASLKINITSSTQGSSGGGRSGTGRAGGVQGPPR
jgi:hypothetical protein